MMLPNAVLTSHCNAICLCETCPTENIDSQEIFLKDCDIYRKHRQLDGYENGCSLMAVKNTFVSEQIRTPCSDSCVTCTTKLSTLEVFIRAIYNPPQRKCITPLRGKFPTTPEKHSKKQAIHNLP